MSRWRRLLARTAALRSTTAGFLGVGVSGVVLLAAGPRLVGVDDYSALALVWTAANLFGLGVAQPLEQATTRSVAAGRGSARATSGARLIAGVAVALSVLFVGATWLGLIDAMGPRPALAVLGSIGFLGWAVLAPARGVAAGELRMQPYAGALAVEASTRVAIVAAAWFAPASWRLGLLVLAVGVPVLVSVLPLRRLAPGPPLRADTEPRTREVAHELAGFTSVALANQIVLNSAALWLGWTGALGVAFTGAFVTATTYLRAPTLLLGGLLAVSLSRQSALWSAGRWDELRAAALRYWGVTTAYAVVSTGLLLVVSPWALRLFYGSDLDVPVAVLAALAVSSIVGMLAWSIAQSLLGAHALRGCAVAWLVAAGLATVCFAMIGSVGQAALSAGLILGPVAAVVAQWMVWAPLGSDRRR